jgi:hypothetical protein
MQKYTHQRIKTTYQNTADDANSTDRQFGAVRLLWKKPIETDKPHQQLELVF